MTDKMIEMVAREHLAAAHDEASKPLIAHDIRMGNLGRLPSHAIGRRLSRWNMYALAVAAALLAFVPTQAKALVHFDAVAPDGETQTMQPFVGLPVFGPMVLQAGPERSLYLGSPLALTAKGGLVSDKRLPKLPVRFGVLQREHAEPRQIGLARSDYSVARYLYFVSLKLGAPFKFRVPDLRLVSLKLARKHLALSTGDNGWQSPNVLPSETITNVLMAIEVLVDLDSIRNHDWSGVGLEGGGGKLVSSFVGDNLVAQNDYPAESENEFHRSEDNELRSPVRDLPVGARVLLVMLSLVAGVYYFIAALRISRTCESLTLAAYLAGGCGGLLLGITLIFQSIGAL